ncbi:iron-containing alcohol dehydrogenase [Pediococcus stilesii]|uniref:Iron-containing alcohol dehydrogenase n=1 Tax=Pediococcus stilesii TaxID=331679 RepID=A0A5R9BUT4_9LACO|nr:iron-containing alcohol dehydrogenase [Pediococcus stilesii]TLQ04305.1 iron-containing alcohol dehydrogenase [Pediococcus stilesii]
MNKNFDFIMPSVNFFGAGVIEKIGKRAQMVNIHNALIITDSFLEKMPDGPVEQTINSLKKANINFSIYNEVEPNPKVRNIEAAKKVYLENNCDGIITVGGGSAHDTGKGTGIILTNGDDITKLAGIETLENALPPLIAVNTTAGTGSELTRHCVITNEETKLKFVVVSWRNVPLVSFNDPELMLNVPAKLTASTGLDTFVQAIEPYVSVNRNDITDGQCLQAIKLVEESLREAVANGHNLEARTKMVEAEMLGGMAFNNADLGYVHAMAHQLGGQYDAPHGVCCAILLPIVERFNIIAAPERFADLAVAMGENIDGLSIRDAADKAIDAMQQLNDDINIPRSIKAIGAKPEDFELMAENALKDGNAFSNPRKATKAEIVELYQQAYDAE